MHYTCPHRDTNVHGVLEKKMSGVEKGLGLEAGGLAAGYLC